MAHMIPAQLEEPKNSGEEAGKAVFDALRKLTDDYYVFHSVSDTIVTDEKKYFERELDFVIVNQKKYTSKGVLIDSKRYEAASKSNQELRTKTPNLDELIQNLSGGNQQKVLLARWLLTEPDILILDEPTRGIDVGAKYEIYTIMQQLVKAGKSIIMISSEMPELLGMSDRIMVMAEGKLKGILDAKNADSIAVMNLATKFED